MTEISNLDRRSVQSAFIEQRDSSGSAVEAPMSDVVHRRQVLTAALAGRGASQLLAAERMRESGGASALERLLNLNVPPSFVGAFPPPPGNREALRHLSPAMRRGLLTALLAKRRQHQNHPSRMLDLLDELLKMQEHALSQMGSFAQG